MPRWRPTEYQYRSADVPGRKKIFNPLTGAMCVVREEHNELIGGGSGAKTLDGDGDAPAGFRAAGWSGGSTGMAPAQLNKALTMHLLGRDEECDHLVGTSRIIKPGQDELEPLKMYLNGDWDCPQCGRRNDHFLARCLDCNSSKYDRTANLNIKASSKRVRVIQSHSCPDCGWLHFHKNSKCIGCGKVNEEFLTKMKKLDAIREKQNPTGSDKILADGMAVMFQKRTEKKRIAEEAEAEERRLEALRNPPKEVPKGEEESKADDSPKEDDPMLALLTATQLAVRRKERAREELQQKMVEGKMDPADIGGGYLDGVPLWLKQEMIAKNKLNPRFNRTGKPLQTYENNKLLGIHAEHGPQGLPPGMTAEMMITPPPPPDSKDAPLIVTGFQEDESSSDDEEPPPPPDTHGSATAATARAEAQRRARGTPSNSDSDLTDSEDEDKEDEDFVPPPPPDEKLDLFNVPTVQDDDDSSDSDSSS